MRNIFDVIWRLMRDVVFVIMQMKAFFIFFETAIRQERLGARLFHLDDSKIFSTIGCSIGWRRIYAPKLNLGATILCGIYVLQQFVGNSGREDVRGLHKINLESDYLDAVRILNGKSTSLLGNGLVATIFKLLRYDWMVSINHINRACNGVADRLATLSKANSIDDLQLLEPPAEVLSLMQMEAVDFCNL
ncbi:hypothetical protein V6N11_018671 [Hibiscus sabdariffa]|uniref:RNase H type-1 domain-containing protein n=1 Tax=Hibiscus sabdariffa TaxID=183260 RepID=A0ABR2QTF6_9ROSI